MKLDGHPLGEICSWVGSGEHSGASNIMSFQLLKAREAGKTVVFFDYESSFDSNKYFSTNQDQGSNHEAE
jgi:hypothetical protein